MKNLKYLVLDEADRMLSMNFEESLTRILLELPKKRKTFLFSATMTSSVSKLQRASLKDPVKVSVSNNKYGTVDELNQTYMLTPAKWKFCYLAFLVSDFSGNAIMVFCGTCLMAKRVSVVLRILGFTATVLTGKMTHAKRLKGKIERREREREKFHDLTSLSLAALTKFKANEKNILVATDVASRGLDIPSVDLVINFDIPVNPKDYVHRVGRTARAGRAGNAVTLVTQYDVETFKRIEELVGKQFDPYEAEEKEVLTMLSQVETAEKLAQDQMRDEDQKEKERKQRRKKRLNAKFGNEEQKDSSMNFVKKQKVTKKKIN